MAKGKGKPLPWRFERDANQRVVAAVSCLCGARSEIANTSGAPPEWIAKKFRARGWALDTRHADAVCPKCSGAEPAPRALHEERPVPLSASTHLMAPGSKYVTEAALRRRAPDVLVIVEQPADEAAPAHPAPAREQQEEAVGAQVVGLKTTPRELTPKEQRAVYAELEQHFDEKAGLYRGGHSDDAIGERLGVPRACVAQLREVAFGPLKSDPEIAALRAAIEAAGAELGAMRNMMDEATRRFAELRERAERLERDRQRRGG